MSSLVHVRSNRRFSSRLFALGLTLVAAASTPSAQVPRYPDAADVFTPDWSDEVPAYVAIVDGDAWVERDARRDTADENLPLLASDVISTARGRVEVAFDDHTFVDLDQWSDVTFIASDLARLDRGQIRIAARGRDDYRVDAMGGFATLRSPGEYRLSVSDPRSPNQEIRVIVLDGSAELESAGGRTLVRAGFEARSTVHGGLSRAYPASSAASGAFDRWVDNNRRDWGGVYTRYLPDELRRYDAALYHDGDWRYLSPYGYVWYPRVASDWRPYSDGRWVFAGSFGWTWVGAPRWSWPTHHYGRWGRASDRWYWIPGNRWAPAWVSWASSPGYVGWCPLGFDNRPVISVTTVTFWRGWTTVPSRSFTQSVAVTRVASRPNGSAARFVMTRSGPSRPADERVESRPLTRAPQRTAAPRASRTINTGQSARPTQPSARPEPSARTEPSVRSEATSPRRVAVPSAPERRPAVEPSPRVIEAPASRPPARARSVESRGEPQLRPEGPAPTNRPVRASSRGSSAPASAPAPAPRTESPQRSGAERRAPERVEPRSEPQPERPASTESSGGSNGSERRAGKR